MLGTVILGFEGSLEKVFDRINITVSKLENGEEFTFELPRGFIEEFEGCELRRIIIKIDSKIIYQRELFYDLIKFRKTDALRFTGIITIL